MDAGTSGPPAWAEVVLPAAPEPASPRRRAGALAAALLLHGLIAGALLLVAMPVPTEPLVVDIVMEPGGGGGTPGGGTGAGAAGEAAGGAGRQGEDAGEAATPQAAEQPTPATPHPEPPTVADAQAPPWEKPPRPVARTRKEAPRPATPPREPATQEATTREQQRPEQPPAEATPQPPAPAESARQAATAEAGAGHSAVSPFGTGGGDGSRLQGTGGSGNGSGGTPGYTLGSAANPPPIYPPAARRRGIEGEVVLRVLVSADGRARSVEIAKSSGSDLLDEAARNALARWRFRPAMQSGVAVDGKATVPVRFALIDR